MSRTSCASVIACCIALAAMACGETATRPPPAASASDTAPWAILSIDPAVADVSSGATLHFGAALGPVPAQGVVWTVLEGPTAGSVDASGTYAAPAQTGVFHLSATSSGQTALSTVTVKHGGAIAIRPNPARALPHGTSTLAATVTGLPDENVTWSLLEGAAAGTVSATGEYFSSGPGRFHVVATSVVDPSVRAMAEVEVTADLADHGGPILARPAVRALWWGTPQDFGDAIDTVGTFLSNVSGSAWLAILEEYLRGASARVSYLGDFFVPGPAPASPPGLDELISDVCSALDALGIAPDAETIYLLFTPAQQGNGWWGTHWYGSCHGVTIYAAWIARRSLASGCGTTSPEAQAAVATVSHELAETMTDPRFYYSWISWDAQEISDRCTPTCVDLAGVVCPLDALWSNAAQACVVR